MKKALWIVVDLENDELPLFVGMTAQEVAEWAGTSQESVYSGIFHAKERGGRSRFARVYLDEDDELLREEKEGRVFGIIGIAKYIGTTHTTLKRHIEEVPLHRVGRKWYAEQEELDEWMKDQHEWLTGKPGRK